MDLLNNKPLLALALVSAASFFAWLWIVGRFASRLETQRGLRLAAVLWVLLFTVEFWILGPYSFIAWDSEGNFSLAFYNYLTRQHPGGVFAHAVAGGQDTYSMYAGRQLFQPEVFLSGFAPPWIVVLVHKLMVVCAGLGGGYLLARDVGKAKPAASFAAAALFTYSHLYLLNVSTSFSGAGFAAIPLGLWIMVAQPRPRHHVWAVFAIGALLATTDPVHTYPALATALIGLLVLAEIRDWRRIAFAMTVFVVMAVVNWAEVLYGLAVMAAHTHRGFGLSSATRGIGDILAVAFGTLPAAAWPILVPMALAWVVLLVKDIRFALVSAFAVAGAVGAYVAAELIPWEKVGLTHVKGLEHAYMLLGCLVIAVPVVARGLSAGFGRTPVMLALAMALAVASWTKLSNAAQMLWFGGQSNYFGYTALLDPSWRPREPFRVVTLFDTPPPNVIAGLYGLEAFDGGVNLNPWKWQEYWFEIVRRNPAYLRATRTRIEWAAWDGGQYHLDRHLRVDLLEAANVRFVLSALPLAPSDEYRAVYAPEAADIARLPQTAFPSLAEFIRYRFKRIFDTGQLFVYELRDALPRAYGATRIVTVADGAGMDAVAERAADILGRAAVVEGGQADALPSEFAELRVAEMAEIVDGYEVRVDAEAGGVLVLNAYHLPYWRAEIDGNPARVVPANGVHMAVAVPPGARVVRFLYQRPTLLGG